MTQLPQSLQESYGRCRAQKHLLILRWLRKYKRVAIANSMTLMLYSLMSIARIEPKKLRVWADCESNRNYKTIRQGLMKLTYLRRKSCTIDVPLRRQGVIGKRTIVTSWRYRHHWGHVIVCVWALRKSWGRFPRVSLTRLHVTQSELRVSCKTSSQQSIWSFSNIAKTKTDCSTRYDDIWWRNWRSRLEQVSFQSQGTTACQKKFRNVINLIGSSRLEHDDFWHHLVEIGKAPLGMKLTMNASVGWSTVISISSRYRSLWMQRYCSLTL